LGWEKFMGGKMGSPEIKAEKIESPLKKFEYPCPKPISALLSIHEF
jgi:hypothetical protein